MGARWTDGQRENALQTLANGGTIKEAAAASGVSETTLYRRLNDPEFNAALKERVQIQVGRARRINNGGAPKCARFLTDVGSGSKKASSPQVQAAIAVLKFAGMTPPKQVEISGALHNLSDDDLAAQLAAEAQAMGDAMAEGSEDG